MDKWRIGLFVILILLGIFGAYYFYNQQKLAKITNFELCVEAGFPIMESYPPQCRTSDGRNFTQEIGNELNFIDEILITLPRPNQIITSPQQISGKALGSWFFEGSFAAELYDENGLIIGTAVLTAQGEWMTEEFVPFAGELKFKNPDTPKGTLTIKNANPSGLSKYEKTITIPVEF